MGRVFRIRSIYLLNASSREERQQWMAAVKRCQEKLSPKSSPSSEHKQISPSSESKDTKQIVTNGRSSETKNTETPVNKSSSKSPDQASDSDSSGEGSSTLNCVFADIAIVVYKIDGL